MSVPTRRPSEASIGRSSVLPRSASRSVSTPARVFYLKSDFEVNREDQKLKACDERNDTRSFTIKRQLSSVFLPPIVLLIMKRGALLLPGFGAKILANQIASQLASHGQTSGKPYYASACMRSKGA